MSDNAQLLAARVAPSTTGAVAARAIAWMVEHAVVEPTPTDSGLGQLAHRPGSKVLDVVLAQRPGVYDFRTLVTNGVEVRHSPRPMLQTAGDEVPTFRCPACKVEIDADEVFALLDDLQSPFRAVPEIPCPGCAERSALDTIEAEGGVFANVVLCFWNWWPLRPSFIASLEQVCGAPLVVLHEHF
jgi:hypothetical protein